MERWGWTVSLGLGLPEVRIGRLWVLRTDGTDEDG